MINKTFSKIANIQEKIPNTIIAIFILFTLFMAYNATFLKTDSSFDVLFKEDSQSIELKRLVSNEFGSNDKLFVLVTLDEDVNDQYKIKDIRDPQVLQAMVELQKSIKQEPSVSDVFSATDILLMQYGRLPNTLEESKYFFNNLAINKNQIINDDYDSLNMAIDVNIPEKSGSVESIEKSIREIVEASKTPLGVDFVLTGEPILLNHVMELLINDNTVTVFIALIAVFIILALYFRSASIATVAITPVLLTLTYLTSTMVFMDIKITMITAAIGAMMVGMSVDYSIHITHGFYERIKKHNDPKTLEYVVTHVGGALFASALTTLFGFIAMTLGDSPMARTQGIVLSTGIIFAFLSSILLLPPLLKLCNNYGLLDTKHKVKKSKKPKLVMRLLNKLASFQVKNAKKVLFIFGVTTFLLVPGMSLVWMDTDNENWFEDNDPVLESLMEISNTFEGVYRQNILIMINESNTQNELNDLRDVDFINKLSLTTELIEELEFVSDVSTPTNIIKSSNNGRLINYQHELNEQIKNNDQIKSYFNSDYTIIKISAGILGSNQGGPNNVPSAKYYEILNQFDSVGFSDNIIVVGQGTIAQDMELDQSLSSDIMKTTLFGFIFVFLIALFIYKSLPAGFMAILPVIFCAIWTVSIMGYVNLPFTVLTTGMLAIVMGVGIDYSIHLIHTTKEYLKQNNSIEEAISKSLTSTGESIFVSTLTTVVGFCALIFASLVATQRLGFTLAIAIACCFIICMLIVPATLVIEHNIKQKNNIKEKIRG